MWSYWICDTRTGEKQLRVEPSGAPFSRVLNGAGKGSASFVLTAESPMRDKALSTPWARTLVHCWDDVPIYAGLIETRSYSHNTATLSLTTVDVRGLLAVRFPFGVGSYWANEAAHVPGKLECVNLSLRSIAARVVAAGLVGPSAIYSLPIVTPSVVEAGPYSMTFENYNFQTVADLLQDLQEMDGGPDVDFEPRWSAAGTLEYVMRVGPPSVPLLSGETFEFNMSAEVPRLTNVKVTDNATKQVTGVFSIGAGSEVDMRVGGWGFSGSSAIPARDDTQSYKQETSESVLASYSVAATKALGVPTRQWEMSCLASVEPGLDRLKLGSILRLFFTDDLWVTESKVDLRLISFSGDSSEKITLDVQPWA